MEPVSLYDWIKQKENIYRHKDKVTQIYKEQSPLFNSMSRFSERGVDIIKNIKKIRSISNEYKFKVKRLEGEKSNHLLRQKLSDYKSKIFTSSVDLTGLIKKKKESLDYVRKINESNIQSENAKLKQRLKKV